MAGFKNGKNNKISDHMVTGMYIGNTGKMIKPERRNENAYKDFKRPLYGMKVGDKNES